MKSLWFVLALILIAAAAWLAWGYFRADDVAKEISDRLPSTAQLDAMGLEDTQEALAAAMVACGRLPSLQWNPLARLVRGDEIAMLADHCELLGARVKALSGP